MIRFNNLKGVVLDIEGTTCPLDFVVNSLFPYARQALPEFIAEHRQDPQLSALWEEVEQAITAETAIDSPQEIADYLQWLIDQDRKFTPLKDLQGLIWQQGYNSGSLVAPLFDDVESALKTWHQQGLILAVYSSGSIAAQQLLYGNSIAGDLRGLFTSWFDTRLGSKVNSQSYIDLAKHLAIPAAKLLFISDAPDELKAAKNAGLQVCGSQRPGNIQIINEASYKTIKKFSELELTNALN